ncbi:MAG: hypothetical protein K0S41_3707, partial [Anaerocolumna sp.]|nr:hypothetical protein [Anaerocolumna sp.]
CQQHNLVNPFEQIESYDIYRKLNPYKKKLPLTNLKLKTIEAFVHFTRLDLFSGEELIQIYANYLGKVQYERLQEKIQRQLNTNKTNPVVSPLFNQTNKSQNPTSNELLNQILLHNLEDIKGLIKVSDILFYVDLFESFTEDSLQNTYKHEFKIITLTKTIDQSSVLVEMSLPYTLPTSVIWSLSLESLLKNETDLIHFVSGLTFKLEVFLNRLRLTIPLFHGELKVFYENYRDYYYLIKEDYAIHQSIAQYVDKEYRVKAKPATCYSKKTGNFLPQPVEMFLPALKLTYSDKMYYFEESNLVNGNVRTKEYINSVIHFILTNKNTELFTN